eukprot:EG_transcript_4717
MDWILCGLCNVGNTCYMNSGLQALVGTPPFVSALQTLSQPLAPPSPLYTAAARSTPAQRSFLKRLTHLVHVMGTAEDSFVNPSEFLQAVVQVNPTFAGFQQQDAQELFRCVLGAVHEECSDTMNVECVHQRLTQPGLCNSSPAAESSRRQLSLLEFTCQLYHHHKKLEQAALQRRKAGCSLVAGFLSSLQPLVAPTLERGPVPDLFQGLLLSRIVCGKCAQPSETIEKFLDVSLEIPTPAQRRRLQQQQQQGQRGSEDKQQQQLTRPSSSWRWLLRVLWAPLTLLGRLLDLLGFGSALGPVALRECVAAFCAVERLAGANRYRCEHCQGPQEATKQLLFLELPEVLVVHAKRFNFGALWGSKIGDWIHFPVPPETLDLRDYCYETAALPPPEDTQYSLFAVVVHKGGYGSGHYVAYVLKENDWFLCDDETVRRVTLEEVAGCSAYVLCFRKVPRPDPVLALGRTQAEQYLSRPASAPLPADVHYVARHWLHRLLATQAPGFILNDPCYCSAETLESAANAVPAADLPTGAASGSPRCHFHYPVQQLFVPVGGDDWRAWAAHFGGGPAIPAQRFQALQHLEREWLRAASGR